MHMVDVIARSCDFSISISIQCVGSHSVERFVSDENFIRSQIKPPKKIYSKHFCEKDERNVIFFFLLSFDNDTNEKYSLF